MHVPVQLGVDILCDLRERVRSVFRPEKVLLVEVVRLLLCSASFCSLYQHQLHSELALGADYE